MKIIVDYREEPSGIADLLMRRGIDVSVEKIACGDYIINNRITIERKTASDFVVSIFDGRLFKQASRLKTNTKIPLFLIEGNPFRTDINIDRCAVRGAILTVQTIYYLPVVYSRAKEETVQVMRHMAHLSEKNADTVPLRGGYRPRKLNSRQLYLLQGLPGIGPQIAKRLLKRFGSVSKALAASVEKLNTVEGIGPVSAKKIREVIDESWHQL